MINGNNNIVIGLSSGQTLTGGTGNVFIGNKINDGSGSTDINNNGSLDISNTVVLGGNNIENTYLYGNVYAGPAQLQINSSLTVPSEPIDVVYSGYNFCINSSNDIYIIAHQTGSAGSGNGKSYIYKTVNGALMLQYTSSDGSSIRTNVCCANSSYVFYGTSSYPVCIFDISGKTVSLKNYNDIGLDSSGINYMCCDNLTTIIALAFPLGTNYIQNCYIFYSINNGLNWSHVAPTSPPTVTSYSCVTFCYTYANISYFILGYNSCNSLILLAIHNDGTTPTQTLITMDCTPSSTNNWYSVSYNNCTSILYAISNNGLYSVSNITGTTPTLTKLDISITFNNYDKCYAYSNYVLFLNNTILYYYDITNYYRTHSTPINTTQPILGLGSGCQNDIYILETPNSGNNVLYRGSITTGSITTGSITILPQIYKFTYTNNGTGGVIPQAYNQFISSYGYYMINLYITYAYSSTGNITTPFNIYICSSTSYADQIGTQPPTYNFSNFYNNAGLIIEFSTILCTYYYPYNLSSNVYIVPTLTGHNSNSINVQVVILKIA